VSQEAAPAASSPRSPGYVPGAKRARHKRWTRVATAVTVATLLAFGAVVALLVSGGEKTDPKTEACRISLEAIAAEVRGFAVANQRLPRDLNELFGPEGSSQFDAEPWDCWHHPFEYRVVDAATWDFRLRSRGADEEPDTADDIVWPEDKSWN
jgi:hypothetical protein